MWDREPDRTAYLFALSLSRLLSGYAVEEERESPPDRRIRRPVTAMTCDSDEIKGSNSEVSLNLPRSIS